MLPALLSAPCCSRLQVYTGYHLKCACLFKTLLHGKAQAALRSCASPSLVVPRARLGGIWAAQAAGSSLPWTLRSLPAQPSRWLHVSVSPSSLVSTETRHCRGFPLLSWPHGGGGERKGSREGRSELHVTGTDLQPKTSRCCTGLLWYLHAEGTELLSCQETWGSVRCSLLPC